MDSVPDQELVAVWPWDADKQRWEDHIQRMHNPIQDAQQLDALLTEYIVTEKKEDVTVFQKIINTEILPFPKEQFFSVVLPFIQKASLELPSLVQDTPPFPLLIHGGKSITIGRRLTECLLANAFFGMLPPQMFHPGQKTSRKVVFSLFYRTDRHTNGLFCILNYFYRACTEPVQPDTPAITIQRKKIGTPECPAVSWETSELPILAVTHADQGKIEDSGGSVARANFAASHPGGFVLGTPQTTPLLHPPVSPGSVHFLLFFNSFNLIS